MSQQTKTTRHLHVPINAETVARETDSAYGCDFGQAANQYGKVPLMWFPKSQCRVENGVIVVPEWLARKNGMLAWRQFGCELK